jgi:hypothetical protein
LLVYNPQKKKLNLVKSEYQYKPLTDSLLGKALSDTFCKVYQEPSSRLEAAIASHLKEGAFFVGTKKAEKQVLLRILPDQIRKWIKEIRYTEIVEEIVELIQGTTDQPPKIDVALELIEWLLSGFDEDILIQNLLSELTNRKIQFDLDFIRSLKNTYNEEIAEEMNHRKTSDK